MNAWNPVIKIGEQIREAMREHYPENSKQENIEKIDELFKMAYDKFNILNSSAVPLNIDNVDTDQIIPTEYLKSIKKFGYED